MSKEGRHRFLIVWVCVKTQTQSSNNVASHKFILQSLRIYKIILASGLNSSENVFCNREHGVLSQATDLRVQSRLTQATPRTLATF